mgnify:CR=1 FL=1
MFPFFSVVELLLLAVAGHIHNRRAVVGFAHIRCYTTKKSEGQLK